VAPETSIDIAAKLPRNAVRHLMVGLIMEQYLVQHGIVLPSDASEEARYDRLIGDDLKEIDPRYHELVTRLYQESLKELQKYGRVLWLNEEPAAMPDGGTQPQEATPLGPNVRGALEAIAQDLSPEELDFAADALKELARARADHEAAQRAEAQRASLEKVTRLTEEIEARRAELLDAIRGARAWGASWTTIGNAAGVKRDVAFKRWASLVNDPLQDDN
jgi:hypothetical protein